MKEKETWEDVEFSGIATKIYDMYKRFFPDDFSLENIFFLRTSGTKPKWISRIRRCGHPWGSLPGLENIIYLVETADDRWKTLGSAQQALVVFHELKHVPVGGCDFNSENCGKLLDHPVQDFAECIAAANGNLFWSEPGHDDIPNILDTNAKFDLEEALKRTGYIKPDGTIASRPVTIVTQVGNDENNETHDDSVDVQEAQ